MSFDKFLLAVESRDLSQADKSIIIVSDFPTISINFIKPQLLRDRKSSATSQSALGKKTTLL